MLMKLTTGDNNQIERKKNISNESIFGPGSKKYIQWFCM